MRTELHNIDLYDLYTSLIIADKMAEGGIGGTIARMADMLNVYKIVVRKYEKKSLWRSR